jgi:alkylated DNA repair dioxygenase AlkB
MLCKEQQLGFNFGEETHHKSLLSSRRISLPDADLEIYPEFFSDEESKVIFSSLRVETKWEQGSIVYFGTRHRLPRLTAWYGDPGARYTYSRIANAPHAWTTLLLEIKRKVELMSLSKFNSVLLNFYRSGADSVAWHQDNEPELGESPTIASVSFGATRPFQMRHKSRQDLRREDIMLSNGSLLIMRGSTQKYWEHQIPKTARPIGERINLTFRYIHHEEF